MGCCDDKVSDLSTQEVIRQSYGKIAVQGGGCCGILSASPSQVSRAVGYEATDLENLPEGTWAFPAGTHRQTPH